MFSYPLYAYNLQAQFTWGSQGRVEQWHNKNVHPPQLMKIEALTLSPVNSRTPSFCHFLCNSWNKLAHLQLQCAIQGCSYSSHSNYFPAQEKYPQEQALAIGIHRGIKSRCSCSCWAHRHSLFLYSTAQLWALGNTWGQDSFRPGVLFFTGRQIWVRMKEAKGLKDIFKTASQHIKI